MNQQQQSAHELDRTDLLFIGGVLALACFYVAKLFDFGSLPYEDAAIVMRYAVHLAEGHGITWNIGEPPVDGTTDFLFLVVLAAVVKAGMGAEAAVRFVGFVAHTLTILLVYFGIRDLYRKRRWVAAACAAYLAIGPGIGYISGYFGTPFFGLWVCLSWYLALKTIAGDREGWTAFVFAAAALLMGLARPEGVFLAILMMAAIICARGFKRSRQTLLFFLAIYLIVGGGYFLWRWNYFGHPLPNPYYRKGAYRLYPESLMYSIKNVIVLCAPILLIYLTSLRSMRLVKKAVVPLIPVVGFTLIWILLSNNMNYVRRFQYATIPILLLSAPAIWPVLSGLRGVKKTIAVFLSAVLLAGFVAYGGTGWLYRKHRQYVFDDAFHDGRYDAAMILREYAGKGYIIATTEAGIIPFYSQWNVVDTWGLNDPWVARNVLITKEYLDRFKPEIIMFHADMTVMEDSSSPYLWEEMVIRLREYAESEGYVLAALFKPESDLIHAFYIKPGFPDSDEIIERIRSMKYVWYLTGKLCTNLVDADGQLSH